MPKESSSTACWISRSSYSSRTRCHGKNAGPWWAQPAGMAIMALTAPRRPACDREAQDAGVGPADDEAHTGGPGGDASEHGESSGRSRCPLRFQIALGSDRERKPCQHPEYLPGAPESEPHIGLVRICAETRGVGHGDGRAGHPTCGAQPRGRPLGGRGDLMWPAARVSGVRQRAPAPGEPGQPCFACPSAGTARCRAPGQASGPARHRRDRSMGSDRLDERWR